MANQLIFQNSHIKCAVSKIQKLFIVLAWLRRVVDFRLEISSIWLLVFSSSGKGKITMKTIPVPLGKYSVSVLQKRVGIKIELL